jgi:cytoskeletal protein CcmA (bactofilin family)
MLGKKDESAISGSGDLNTLIGKGSVLEGKITVSSNIRVDGKIKGDLKTNDSLVIGKQGEIEGEITAKNTVVGGKVIGKIIALGKVVLESNAIFKGEIKAARLVIDDGAVFDGQCTMNNGGNLEPESKKDKQPAKSG